MEKDSPLLIERIAAWSVHALTASGGVIGLLALVALIQGDFRGMLLWLGIALVVDGLDGPLARLARVDQVTPRFDGAVLDLVVDYFNYAVIPALAIWRFQMVPEGFELLAAGFAIATSLYCFGNKDMKTDDYYFKGFPAVWNLVVLVFYLIGSNPWFNLLVIGLLGALTFSPLKFVHPFRVRRGRGLTLIMTLIWAALTFALVFLGEEEPLSVTDPIFFWLWVAASLYFVGLSLRRTLEAASRSNDARKEPNSGKNWLF
jgi:phosphatidylcholine synthase